MIEYTTKKLIEEGYTIENVMITKADLYFEDHGVITFDLILEGAGFGVTYGGYCLGHGFLGSDYFDGSENGIEYIARIMDTVGVSSINDLKNKYVRIANKHGSCIKIIGNIIKEKWFDAESFFKDKENENNNHEN